MAKKAKIAKEEPKQRVREKAFDIETDNANTLVEQWMKAEPDSIYGMNSNNAKHLGVSRGLYSRLPNIDAVLAKKSDNNSPCLPLNKILEIFGKESSGKTTWMKYLANLFISHGGISIFVDFEHKFDPAWLRMMGKQFGLTEDDYRRFMYIDPVHFEWFVVWLVKMMKKIIDSRINADQALKELNNKKKKPDDYAALSNKYMQIISMPIVILVDSVASIYTAAEVEGEEETTKHVGELARGFSAKLKHIRKHLGMANTLIVFSNQERDKISMGGKPTYGMLTTPGGHAIKHNADGRIRIYQARTLKRTRDSVETVYGVENVMTITKNQMGYPPFGEATVRLLYDRGYHTFHAILEACVAQGIVKKTGSRYTISGNTANKIEFEQTEIDEIELKYPKLENILHGLYKKKMQITAE